MPHIAPEPAELSPALPPGWTMTVTLKPGGWGVEVSGDGPVIRVFTRSRECGCASVAALVGKVMASEAEPCIE